MNKKQSISRLLILIGLCATGAVLVLILTDVLDYGTLYTKYALILSLLALSIGLTFVFRKYTAFDEAHYALKRIKKRLTKIQQNGTKNSTRYVTFLTLKNLLINTVYFIEDIVSEYDLFSLNKTLAEINSVLSLFDGLDSRTCISMADVEKAILCADQALEDIKREEKGVLKN